MRRVAAILLLALAGGCAPGSASSSDVVLDEYSIGSSAGRLAAGHVELAVSNAGEFSHTLIVTGEDGAVVAATDPIEPGEAMSLSLDLPEGTYRFSCRIVVQLPDGRIVDHYEQGMTRTVRVSG